MRRLIPGFLFKVFVVSPRGHNQGSKRSCRAFLAALRGLDAFVSEQQLGDAAL